MLQNEKVHFSVSIVIYSSYSYVRQTYVKEIQKNVIRKYKSTTSDKTLHLFLAPNLTNSFNLFILNSIKDPISFNPNDVLNNQHLNEGITMYRKQKNNTQTTLNQENCICDHPETQQNWNYPRYENLTSTYFQTRFLYENLKAIGLLDELLERKLKICSEISFLSFDTEALNKEYLNLTDGTFYDQFEFKNDFIPTFQKKIIRGEQQIYIIGLCDIIPVKKTIKIFEKYLPKVLFQKITRYVQSDCQNLRSHIGWAYCKSKLEMVPLEKCAQELLTLFEQNTVSEKHIKTFHISNNDLSFKSTEPNHSNTTQMIYKFLVHIYQRNILATIVKYILLKSLIVKFESSELIQEKRGIFYLIYKRMQEIIFESVMTAFNGQNYDNYLLCNHLIIIITKLNEKIRIFKKGASLSTIHLIVKNNLNRFQNILEKDIKISTFQSKVDTKWLMKLYIKDFRNLVATNMSLDKIGKLFNLKVSKLCFPYEQAKSIKKIKNITSLQPTNDLFWKDNFSNKTVDLETRLEAQSLYNAKQFKNLYDYGEYYLIQDCLLLHEIVLTLFRTYLNESINIFIRRNYSQSSLSYQQFFIIEPSKQIEKNLAPKIVKNTLFNYFIKNAVTGGLCTSFVHGNINKQTIINEHLNTIDNSNLDPEKWPNFENIKKTDNKTYHETPTGISTIDIRSLYPSAAVKKLPVGSPLFFSRFVAEDLHQIKEKKRIINVQAYCEKVREFGDHNSDFIQLINKPPLFYSEFYALDYYLGFIPKNVIILRFQSSFTALGQLYFTKYPLDGFLAYFDPNDNMVYIKLIQYQSIFYHGHRNSCIAQNNPKDIQKVTNTAEIKFKIVHLYNHFIKHFNLTNVNFEYVEISDCDFFQHKIPKNNHFCFPFKKTYPYNKFLTKILNNKLTGFLLVKNLKIKKQAQNPIFGFIIQKVDYGADVLSPYTKSKVPHFKTSQRVVSLNESKSFMVISTEYLNWLNKTFGFENPPDIYHALLFQLDHYLKPYIENKLESRKNLKELIKLEKNAEQKQIYEIQSELIKLMLNSCYGFTLCNITSNKFKVFENRKNTPSSIKAQNRIKSCIQLGENIYLVEINKNINDSFQTLLGQIGSYILYHSKIILVKRLYFLLKYLNPAKAQLLYMDTDSAHFLLKHKNFVDNVDDEFKSVFKQLYNKHFDSGNKLSGIWVEEGFFDMAHYIGEKSYWLSNNDNTNYLTHMKGLNSQFQKQFIEKNININETPIIGYNLFQKSNDFLILKTYVSKNLFSSYVPIKRYFVNANGSLPLSMKENEI